MRRLDNAKFVVARLKRSRAGIPDTSPRIRLPGLQGSALVEFGLDRAVGTGRVAAKAADIVGMIKIA